MSNNHQDVDGILNARREVVHAKPPTKHEPFLLSVEVQLTDAVPGKTGLHLSLEQLALLRAAMLVAVADIRGVVRDGGPSFSVKTQWGDGYSQHHVENGVYDDEGFGCGCSASDGVRRCICTQKVV